MTTQLLPNKKQKDRQQRQVNARSFALFIKRMSIVGLFTTMLLQGCVHVQQPKKQISITHPEASLTVPLASQQSSKQAGTLQVIGSFVVNTESEGAFLEGIRFAATTRPNTLQNVRIKMKGDDQWLSPSEINIYLDSQQQHQFEISALVNTQAAEHEGGTVDFSLSDFRFLKTDATNSIDHSVLNYSIVI